MIFSRSIPLDAALASNFLTGLPSKRDVESDGIKASKNTVYSVLSISKKAQHSILLLQHISEVSVLPIGEIQKFL